MANPNAVGGDLLSTTWSEYSSFVGDAVSKSVALLDKLERSNGKKYIQGGADLRVGSTFQDTGTAQNFRGLQPIDISSRETMTHMQYDLCQSLVTLVRSDLQEVLNRGKHQIYNLYKSQLDTIKREMRNFISTNLYGDGSVLNSVDGLALLISSAPSTGIVAGVDRSLWTFNRNFVFRALTDGGAVKTAANIKDYDNRVLVATTRNSDGPNLIVCDNEDFLLRQKVVNSMQVLVREDKPKMGYREFTGPDGIEVICDGGFQGSCPANTSYFLDTKHIFYRPHAERNMYLWKAKEPERQIASIQHILHYWSLTVDWFPCHAVMTNN
jgi:hypothetical protein